jgi:hypothetical protein
VSSLYTYWPESGTGTADFTVSLSAARAGPVTVVANTADGTATVADGDYLPVTNQTVTIPAGSTSATVPVTIEPNGSKHSGLVSFSLTLSDPSGAFLGTATGTGNIVFGGTAIDEYMAISAAVAVQSTVAAQTVDVPVSINSDVYAATCLVNTADGTATAADHAYVPITNGIITFKSGHPIPTVAVTIPPASTPTGNETFTVNLSDCNVGTVASQPTATVTIVGAADNGPSVEVAPAALQFGAVPEGVTETRQVTLTNTGGSVATITSSAPPAAGASPPPPACRRARPSPPARRSPRRWPSTPPRKGP